MPIATMPARSLRIISATSIRPRASGTSSRRIISARNDPASADPEDLKRFEPVDMVTIDDPLFGGWTAAQKKHFDANGLFDQIYQPANKP